MIKTEFNAMWETIKNKVGDLTSFVENSLLYWVFYNSITTISSNSAITLFNAIPDPPTAPSNKYNSWNEYKEELFGELYDQPISTYASTMKDKETNPDSFNNSVIDAENGWFYGKISDRTKREGGGSYNTFAQQFEMILDDLVKYNYDGELKLKVQ